MDEYVVDALLCDIGLCEVKTSKDVEGEFFVVFDLWDSLDT